MWRSPLGRDGARGVVPGGNVVDLVDIADLEGGAVAIPPASVAACRGP